MELNIGNQQALLAAIIENSEDAIISKNLQSRITSWNKAAEKMFGYTEQEVLGKKIHILIPEDRHNGNRKILISMAARIFLLRPFSTTYLLDYEFLCPNTFILDNPYQVNAFCKSSCFNLFIAISRSCDSIHYSSSSKGKAVFPYNFKLLRFELALPQFGNPENVYFSYRLEPFNNHWEQQGILQNNMLQFGKLEPGNYKLYFRVRNGFGSDQFGITTYEFRVSAPWYQTWWFYFICITGFIIIVWGIVKLETIRINRRKKQLQRLVAAQTENIITQSKQLESQLSLLQNQQLKLEEDNKIKARLIAIISHDMISPLKFMGYMSKKLRNAFKSSDSAYATADTVVMTMQELEALSLNMLNWIRFHYEPDKMKREQFNLHDLITESTEILRLQALEKGIEFHNNVSKDIYVIQYRQALSVIVYNLVMNAVKYTEKGEIRILGKASNGIFYLQVNDTGKGMLAEQVEKLNDQNSLISDNTDNHMKKFQFGYAIIKDLLQLVQGTLSVHSQINIGSKITIEWKVIDDVTLADNSKNSI